MLKRFLSFFLVLALLLCCSSVINSSSENDLLRKFTVNQNAAYEHYSIIIGHYKNNFGSEYTDNYAGAYLDKEGNLNINLVEDISAVGGSIADLKALIKDERVKFNKVKYSFNHLNSIINNLNDKMVDLDIAAIGRDDQNNKVIIYVNNLDDKKISRVKEIINSPAMEFRQQVNKITTTVPNISNANNLSY